MPSAPIQLEELEISSLIHTRSPGPGPGTIQLEELEYNLFQVVFAFSFYPDEQTLFLAGQKFLNYFNYFQ